MRRSGPSTFTLLFFFAGILMGCGAAGMSSREPEGEWIFGIGFTVAFVTFLVRVHRGDYR